MQAAEPARQPAKSLSRTRIAALLCSAVMTLAYAGSDPAWAQGRSSGAASRINWVGVPPAGAKPPPTATSLAATKKGDKNAQMFVNANEIRFDKDNDTVSAVGNVQIHYNGSVLEADRVTYHQKTKKLFAQGNVRMTEADGKIVNADRLELDDKFRNGFVDSLHVETFEKTTLAAARADVKVDSKDNRLSVYQAGVYTACEPCREEPTKPPKWQVKSARIIHSETDKTIYFEDARLELYGIPIAYMPYFWTPDPTVKRQSGFLPPHMMSGTGYGYGLMTPYFFNLAPDYDLTLAPAYLSDQGLLMTGEWRQRLMNGAYNIRASGISQDDQKAFQYTNGDRSFRGAVESRGDFRLAKNWFYGWDATVYSDNAYQAQYKQTRPGQEAVSQAYLFGRGDNSYFDMRAAHFYGLSPLDVQKQLPVLHPLLDYKYKFAQPVFGGELSYSVNAASLSRRQADFDAITPGAARTVDPVTLLPLYNDGLNVCDTQDPAAALLKNRANCLMRGMPGTYSRLSADVMWRKTIVDSYGQIFTPFLWARGDLASVSVDNQPGVGNFLTPGDTSVARVMPAVGLDYRYPFISTHSWGTQIIEPRAQLIARPNESQIGKLPNEDSQSLLFDDTNLFAISKYPGYDRVEGGGRANVGVNYTAQFNQGGYFNAMFGQSYNLFGLNSYAVGDMANPTGLTGVSGNGLENNQSDYVARMTYQPNRFYTFASRFRFDQETMETKRLEIEGRMNFDRWTASVTYGQYDAQPGTGLFLPREGILPAASLKLTQNWTIGGSALYSLDTGRLNTASFSVGYIDECIALNLRYVENYGYQGNIVPNKTLLFQISLRTLGGTMVNQTAGVPGAGNAFGF